MIFKLETERLILREIEESDLNEMYSLDSNEEVQKYIGNQPISGMDEAYRRIINVKEQYSLYGIGRWAVELKSSKKFIGWSGLKLYTESMNGHRGFYELGYRFLPEYWGYSYATEAANALINYGFSSLNLPTIYAITHFDNIKSQRVLEKVGFVYVETFQHEGELTKWYKIDKN